MRRLSLERKHRLALGGSALLAVSAILLLAGCGGNGGMSKDEIVRESNAICVEAGRDVAQLGIVSTDVASFERIARAGETALRRGARRLRRLRPSVELEPLFKTFVETFDAQARVSKDLSVAAGKGDLDRVRELSGQATVIQRTRASVARKLEIRRCIGL